MHKRTEPSAKLQIHIPKALKAEVERQAEADGQLLSVFVQRALVAHIVKRKSEGADGTP